MNKPILYTANGKAQTLQQWSAESNIPVATLCSRMHERGMTLEEALQPGRAMKSSGLYTYQGRIYAAIYRGGIRRTLGPFASEEEATKIREAIVLLCDTGWLTLDLVLGKSSMKVEDKVRNVTEWADLLHIPRKTLYNWQKKTQLPMDELIQDLVNQQKSGTKPLRCPKVVNSPHPPDKK